MSGDIGQGKVILPVKIVRNAVINVRTLLSHPMLTGMSRDQAGIPIPAYFVNEVEVTYGGERIAHFEWSSGISRDPFVGFSLRASKEAPLTVTWKDNKGGVYSSSADVRFTTTTADATR
ncbi:MAG TPA: thiosulfate oxidation carrier complex protein SoxZ [Gemmatimonadaceae bacterium]|nr:thiosulfate oxidation carrier complex protein SoxZ [Gemmatimonadaceae bacterium]